MNRPGTRAQHSRVSKRASRCADTPNVIVTLARRWSRYGNVYDTFPRSRVSRSRSRSPHVTTGNGEGSMNKPPLLSLSARFFYFFFFLYVERFSVSRVQGLWRDLSRWDSKMGQLLRDCSSRGIDSRRVYANERKRLKKYVVEKILYGNVMLRVYARESK